MTVSSSTNKDQSVGDGATLIFNTSFKFFAETDLEVTLTDTTTDLDTPQTLTTHYTVSGGNGATGFITFITEPTSSQRVTILRVMPETQETDYGALDKVPMETIEDDFDKARMVDQQLSEQMGRAIKLSATSTLGALDLPTPQANKLIGWNSGATGLENKAQTDGMVTIPTNAADAKKIIRLATGGLTLEVGPKIDFIPTTGDAGKVVKVNEAEDELELGPLIVKPEILADAAKTFVVGDINKVFAITPTATRVLTLPTTSVAAGDIIEIHNLAAAQKVTIESSDGDDIATFQDGSMRLVALQATPTDRSHWRILDTYGGASPAFLAHRNSSNQLNITGSDQIEFDNDSTTPGFDNNANYNISSPWRFTPTVPGKYLLTARFRWVAASLVANDDLNILLTKGGSSIHTDTISAITTKNLSQSITALVDADGISDAFGVTGININRDTSDIDGAPSVSFFTGRRIGN